jgi:hypothetical protein
MMPNAECFSAVPPPPANFIPGGHEQQMLGLAYSTDAEFAASVRSKFAAAKRGAIALHRCETRTEMGEHLRLHDYAFALIDARFTPMHALENLAATL